MEDTLFENQHLIMDRFSYRFTDPKAGDIIVFLRYEERGNLWDELKSSAVNLQKIFGRDIPEKERLVKRVIGVPGDEIDIRDGYVYVNDIKLEEPYIKGITMENELDLPITVEESQLFVMGDNREVSIDSRDFGLIHFNQIEGKAVFRIFPFDQMGKLN